jgi:signal transduction histidine kinase/CheY-like chemotaxis protein/HPt (histidine-containing phosphotransfer) domain-containing protein
MEESTSPEAERPGPTAPKRGRRIVAIMSCVGLAATLVLLFCLRALWNQQVDAALWVDHTLEVLSAVDEFDHDLTLFVREARSVAIFHGWDRIDAVDRLGLKVPADIARLRTLTADNKGQQAILDAVERSVKTRMTLLRSTIDRIKSGESEEHLLSAAEQQRTWTLVMQISAGSEALKAQERQLLARRRQAAYYAGLRVWAALSCFALIGAASLALALVLQAARTRDRRYVGELSALNAQLERLTRHLVRARDNAERSNRAKTHFLAGMSHELRTPLNGILGYARLLRMEGGLSETQAMRVDAMLSAGKHLLHMVSRVLDLSEIEAERIALQTEAIDLPELVASCLDLIRPGADQKGLALTSSFAPGAPRALAADSMRLQQILINLLGNAVKFTARGGVELRVLPAAAGAGLRIEVADTGPGIPPGQRERLFQDFERLDTEATRAAEGAGLGLSLSARLASFMGGRLGFNDAPGGGSIFWLELPSARLTAPAPETLAPPEPPRGKAPARRGGPLVLLVVDDILMNRDIAGSILAAAGHEVTCVEGGAEAVAAVATKDFDVVLMDVRMPEMDGLEATRRIREMAGPRGRVPILALTAQAFTEQIAECRSAGMNGHLVKPFDADSLLAAVVRAAAAGEAEAPLPAPAMITPPPPPPPAPGSEFPVFDAKSFDRTAEFLASDKVASYLQAIASSAGALAQALRDQAIEGAALAEQAHALASSAGLLGFARAAGLCRLLERALTANPAEAAPLIAALLTALDDSQEHIRRLHAAAQDQSRRKVVPTPS